MTTSQRLLAVAGFIGLAVLLNTTLCEWRFERLSRAWRWDTKIIGFMSDRGRAPDGRRRFANVGVFAQRSEHWDVAIVCGVAVPLFLLGASAYLLIGWRRQARRERGLCQTCGYDLHAGQNIRAKCPECGTPAGSTTRSSGR